MLLLTDRQTDGQTDRHWHIISRAAFAAEKEL